MDREAMTQDLKRIYGVDTLKEAHEALEAFERAWAQKYPKIVAGWAEKSYALLGFLDHPKEIHSYIYPTHQLERLMKEVKRRVKVVEIYCGPEAVEKSYAWWCCRKRTGLRYRWRLKKFAKYRREATMSTDTLNEALPAARRLCCRLLARNGSKN
ncbi:MAG: hypothetical protein GXO72_05665 [Caldiserica bacterium]|nr:hypothetical protein [Caldisericota bacterium]